MAPIRVVSFSGLESVLHQTRPGTCYTGNSPSGQEGQREGVVPIPPLDTISPVTSPPVPPPRPREEQTWRTWCPRAKTASGQREVRVTVSGRGRRPSPGAKAVLHGAHASVHPARQPGSAVPRSRPGTTDSDATQRRDHWCFSLSARGPREGSGSHRVVTRNSSGRSAVPLRAWPEELWLPVRSCRVDLLARALEHQSGGWP